MKRQFPEEKISIANVNVKRCSTSNQGIQIKIIMGFYFTCIQLVKMKKSVNIKYWQGKTGTLLCYM